MITTPAMQMNSAVGAALANGAALADHAVANPAAPNPIAEKSVFLQLLIAQLKHQDPENPADGTQFVTQLAQFTTLEQTTQSRVNLDQILKIMQAAQTAAAPSQS